MTKPKYVRKRPPTGRTITMQLPDPLADRIDRAVADARAAAPGQFVSRSQLIRHLLCEHLALIDNERERADGHEQSIGGNGEYHG